MLRRIPWQSLAAALVLFGIGALLRPTQPPAEEGKTGQIQRFAALAALQPPTAPILAALDTNGDGQLSPDEIAGAVKALQGLDVDQDGELTAEECVGASPPLGMRPGGLWGPEAADVARGEAGFPPGPGGFGPPVPPVLAALDANADGELAEDEWTAAATALQSLDKNGDGELTDDEIAFQFPRGGGPPGGLGGPMHRDRQEILDQFDTDKDGILNQQERAAARQSVTENGQARGGPFGGRGPGRGGPFGMGPFGGQGAGEAEPGMPLTPDDVTPYPQSELYDASIVRTLFFEFENDDWEVELEAFRETDVDVPARLTVDGKVFENVGVRFRGNTSYMMVPRGRKRSLNVSVDYGESEQRLHGYRTLNLLNANADASFLQNVLYDRISRNYLPTLDANFVRVVINGENWGLYVNEEQFNSDFLNKWYGTSDGARWKVPPDFSGNGGLLYLGDDPESYRRGYELKTKDQEEVWQRLVNACRVLNQFREDQDIAALEKVLDVNQALWFLAIDYVLGDDDGYFSRASDYNIFLDERYGRIHLISHDNNETFHEGGGPGGPGFPGGLPGQTTPLSRVDDPSRPLVWSLLSHPQLRARYLAYVRTLAQQELDWNTIGPVFEQYVALIDQHVWDDTRKNSSYGEFLAATAPTEDADAAGGNRAGGPRGFIEQRRQQLLSLPEIAEPYPQIENLSHKVLPDDSDAAQSLLVTAKVTGVPKVKTVLLHYFTDPLAPPNVIVMYDDGSHQDNEGGDGVYAAVIHGRLAGTEVRYYVEAQADNESGTTGFLPVNTEVGAYRYRFEPATRVMAPVVINELMPGNTRSIQDPDGQYADWIELYNLSSSDVDLSGWYLSDALDKPRKWAFPQGTVIAAHGYLLVWADGSRDGDTGLHANFKLSQKGETVVLVDSDDMGNAVIDQVTYEALRKEVSLGRYPCGDGQWLPLVPTAGEPNQVRE